MIPFPFGVSAYDRPKRWTLAVALFALAGLFIGPCAQADDYPSRVIKLIVPYPPGGATDVIGRVMAQKMAETLGAQIIVENRAGATGNIGAAAVASAAPDGYTLLMGALTSHTIAAMLSGAPFSMDKSFAPISLVGTVPLLFIVNPAIKANTLPEYIMLLKSKPGVINYASPGVGSPQHMAGEMFQHLAGVKMLHVPYKGSGPAMVDLIGGHIDSMIETALAAQNYVKSGKVRALATASTERIASLPAVPTAVEAGLKGFDVSSLFGIAAPAGTPPAIINKLNAAMKTILANPAVKESLLAQGVIAAYTTPEQTAAALRAENIKWAKVIKDSNIKAE
jgi:tripartite-type tricarboxylate transporter receptor subunit TctC